MRHLLLFTLAIFSLSSASTAEARDQIRMVGSSTVFPFATTIAETFGKNSKGKTPIVESTGTGGGFKFFCAGVGTEHPDFVNASRAIKDSERALCSENGVSEIVELKIGYDGIVLANTIDALQYSLTKKQIFLALAKEIPQNGKLIENPYKKWNDIDLNLPNTKIEVYGPPPTSGTRDSFVELVLETSCIDLPEYQAAYPDEKIRKKACHQVREDNHYIEAGENDNLIVQKLAMNPKALGIFGFSFLDQNADIVQGALIDGAEPDFDEIAEGNYTVSRPLYIYLKKAHIGKIPNLKAFAEEIVSDAAVAEEGYTTLKGLVPLPKAQHDAYKAAVSAL